MKQKNSDVALDMTPNKAPAVRSGDDPNHGGTACPSRDGTPKLNKQIRVDRGRLSPEDIKEFQKAEATAVDGAMLHRVQPGASSHYKPDR